MKSLIALFFGVLLISCDICGYYNERRYEGINPEWKGYEQVDSRMTGIVSKYIPENPVVFEVGAKDGEDTVKLAALWPKGKIISFEANPNQFMKYQEKARMFSNMYGYNLAVNTYNGTAKFYLCWGSNGDDPMFEGASSLLEPSEAQKIHYRGPEITVPCVIFDDWCKENQVSSIDFMWLDLEGFEMQFLKSSPNILKTVKVIQAETNIFGFRKGTTRFPVLKAFLKKQGFKMVAHWYNEGLQGDAIFVRKELLD
ncbi:MAG TPA: FkbM family methyltransferase [Chlamydiales bacterium]|jgi:FkbM family methyltransferase|nr:FkbM family methyltransferase [Chlamydiales bacterium]